MKKKKTLGENYDRLFGTNLSETRKVNLNEESDPVGDPQGIRDQYLEEFEDVSDEFKWNYPVETSWEEDGKKVTRFQKDVDKLLIRFVTDVLVLTKKYGE